MKKLKSRFKSIISPGLILIFTATVIGVMMAPSKVSSEKSGSLPIIKFNPSNSTEALKKLEARVFELVNTHRTGMHLPPLVRMDVIDEQARKHSLDMATGKMPFSHDGATGRLKLIGKSLKSMVGGGENIFECSEGSNDVALDALNSWLKSPGHRENIEGDYNLSGMGVAQAGNGDYYFTQIFVNGKQ